MQHLDALLLAALRAAPRRYRMPPLPADTGEAAASGTDAALAYAIDAARIGKEEPPPAAVRTLFTQALAQSIHQALAPEGGDPAFQALVMQSQDAAVNEHVVLSRRREADLRAVKAATNAIAHPGKLRHTPPGEVRDALTRLHGLAAAGSWEEIARTIENLLGRNLFQQEDLRSALQAILSSPALVRLVRGSNLLRLAAVRRYQSLCGRQGPRAGTDAAVAKGHASARQGEIAEDAGVQAFCKIVDELNRREEKGAAVYRVVRSLRNPSGFPGDASKAKEEWDAAIVRSDPSSAADIVLLAEIKASPAAATSDLPRLLRGLRRLAQAGTDETYSFASADGDIRIPGASLQGLQPEGDSLPPHVIYCCPAQPESMPPVLSAASKAVLLAEPASLAFAHQLARGEMPSPAFLAPVWDALATAPRLRAALHQYETARAARAAMLHPDDLLASVAQCLERTRATAGRG